MTGLAFDLNTAFSLSRELLLWHATELRKSRCEGVLTGHQTDSCFFLGLSWLTLIILQQLPECQDTCCKCCQENCFPVLEKTALDIDSAFSTNQTNGLELVELFEDMTSIRTKLRNVVNGSVYLG